MLAPTPIAEENLELLADAVGDSLEARDRPREHADFAGACLVLATFAARKLSNARMEHPNALVAAHPECRQDVLALADFIGSTTAIVRAAIPTERMLAVK
jgi:quinolinate synthase